uniref:Uncharacterized protein n=1 Tax=uncultured bacterium ws156A7 TaxID=1131828 RepID=I1X4R4_9BACT|nr:hypothetical protein ws156A7_0010 [uncultured bacterium ws156A7]
MLNDGYRRWVAVGNMSGLKFAVRQGLEHWLAVALELLGQLRRCESAAQIDLQIRAPKPVKPG